MTRSFEDGRSRISPLVWIGVPVGLLIAQYAIVILNRDFYFEYIESETGAVENLTFLLLLIPVLVGIRLLVSHRGGFPQKWISIWFILHVLGSFYFAGEEISWGQHWFGWETSAGIAELNDQQETNLHNMSSWLDQKPRLALILWAFFGGAIAPLLVWRGVFNPGSDRDWLYWLTPPAACLPSGLLVVLLRLPEDIPDFTGMEIPQVIAIRSSETQELMLALFLSFYLISVLRRLRAR